MGKVYEALQRAEAERGRRGAAVGPGVSSQPVVSPARRARAERGRLARIWNRIQEQFHPAQVEDANTLNKRRITLLQPESFVAEQYRTLRARLDALATERPVRTIGVTSSMPGEGKTTTAVNLAIVSSMSLGRRVLLVDCDMRRPKVHAVLGLRPESGLAEILTGDATLEQAVVRVEGTDLSVLAVRATPSNPSELLSSDRMRSLIEELARSYDQVIFDTPPTLAIPDAKIMSELMDGIVFVVRANATPREDVASALDVLDRRRVLGVVLNDVAAEPERYGY
ncbi:MAG: CpsD/CapB family tyrosine-protein kinase [Myxococcota bacterium]|jgi:capsular exopolysaccharide synthesis family protein|nr:CpsD/CapB family tyrosine-protein kinase [Myxococcota bacterium]